MNLLAVKQRFGVISRSKKLDQSLDTAIRVSGTDLAVLITGESGVGKEVFSKIIHSLSARKHNNFIAVNTGAIPAGTINSELFGHEKGAFTGATADRKGYFESVNGGTIFLDEIGEMPLDTQAYLLRVLETGEFIRVGSSKPQKTDVRVVAATNVDLQKKISQGRFREDLYYRLNTVPIHVPALRERPEDIYMLFRKFAVDFSEKYRSKTIHLDDSARQVLENYTWPGNVRELKNVAEQVSVLAEDSLLDAEKIVRIVPTLLNRNLPMLHANYKDGNNSSGGNFQEREILFKLLFDMKNDLNDLKGLIFELIKNNDLNVNDIPGMRSLLAAPSKAADTPNYHYENEPDNNNFEYKRPEFSSSNRDRDARPIIIHSDHKSGKFTETEDLDEELSLVEMEKRFIKKALIKHKGKRKDAAAELDISERTLYRKIKEYELGDKF
jgi:DNA-binding NtrC family response regulator